MKPTALPSVRAIPAPGFTLVELMVAIAVSMLLFASVVALGMFTTKSFSMMGNYVDLDAQSRHAADVMGQQIRDASALLGYSTGNPKYLALSNSFTGQTLRITYSTNNSTLVETETGGGLATSSETLLTGCDDWTFSLYDRAPNVTSTNITFNSTTNAAMCKMINMTWKCSRTILGAKFNTESVQTAQIVLRNQIAY